MKKIYLLFLIGVIPLLSLTQNNLCRPHSVFFNSKTLPASDQIDCTYTSGDISSAGKINSFKVSKIIITYRIGVNKKDNYNSYPIQQPLLKVHVGSSKIVILRPKFIFNSSPVPASNNFARYVLTFIFDKGDYRYKYKKGDSLELTGNLHGTYDDAEVTCVIENVLISSQ